MKSSEFLKAYRALVNLYGAILTDDAYLVLKKYYPSLLKKELYADLKKRIGKMTRWYAVYTTQDHNYLICEDIMSFEDVDYLFELQYGKHRYIPETLEEFLKYSEPTYMEENKASRKLYNYMVSHFKLDSKDALIKSNLIRGMIKFQLRLQDIIDFIETFYEFKNQNDCIAFAKIYQEVNNNTRMRENCGHTPIELHAYETKVVN